MAELNVVRQIDVRQIDVRAIGEDSNRRTKTDHHQQFITRVAELTRAMTRLSLVQDDQKGSNLLLNRSVTLLLNRSVTLLLNRSVTHVIA